jgi:hypothetical protein
MPLDTRIALGVQPLQLADPLAQYSQFAQARAAGTQNALAEQQLATAKLTYDQNKAAQDFVSGVMSKAQENGADVTDPMDAAKQMLMHPNPMVQAMGKHLADAHQLIRSYDQQKAFEIANTPNPASTNISTAASAVKYVPPGSLGGPTQTAVPMPGAIGSGSFDVNALAPVATAAPAAPVFNALTPATTSANALATTGAVNAESISAKINNGDMRFGATPGWKAQREILVKQYEALLNPRQRTFASINPADYTQESIRAFNASGDQADLVPRAPKGEKVFSNLNPAEYTSESIKAFNASGDYSDLVPRAKSEKTIGNVNPADFTARSVAKYAQTNNYADLVPIKPAGGEGEKMPTGMVNVLDPSDPTGKKVIVVTAARAIKEGLVPFTSVPKEGGPTEGERKAATLLQRLQFSQSQLTQALTDNPNAAKPNVFASAVSKLSEPLANTLTTEDRQRVESAQLDMLDAALTLGTGAAYTKEQLEGYRKSYFPQIGDGPKQIKDKQARLENIISAAKIAAGRAEKLVPQVPGASSFDAADAILAKINQGRR